MASMVTTVKVKTNGQYKTRPVGKPNVPSKMCVRCEGIKPLTEFYANRSWTTQSYRDCWCKDCIQKYVIDKEGLKEYFYFNNRRWTDEIWEKASDKAQYVLANNAEFINPKVSKKKKIEIRDACIARQAIGMMNNRSYYTYEEHIGEDGEYNPMMEKTPTEVAASPDGGSVEKKEYNKKWRGYFTASEIETLEDYYAGLEEGFPLTTVHDQDSARKIAKASLDADHAREAYLAGQITLKDYREVVSIFEDMSKTAAFAASKRKAGDSKGLGRLGEIILRVETAGALTENPYTFSPDPVDVVIADFCHTIRAVGAQGGFD